VGEIQKRMAIKIILSKKLSWLYVCIFILSINNINSENIQKNSDTTWQEISEEISSLSKNENVAMDNNFIHSYRGIEGVWQNLKKGQLITEISEKYHSNIEQIKELNEISEKSSRINKSGWYFLPFTKEYLSELANADIKRQVWKVPQGEFLWPVLGTRITSRIGKRMGRDHTGIDIAAQTGTVVIAAMDGEIENLGYQGAYGLSITIMHENDYSTKYAHLSVVLIKKGEKVKKGQIIGYSGSTGYSTGPHLHFEVRYGNIVLNPEFFLSSFEESMESAMGFNEELKNQETEN